MIEIAQIIISFAYILFLSSVIPNIKQVWINRGHLRGFSGYGVFATTIGLFMSQLALALDGAYLPVIIGIPNMLYWLILLTMLYKQGAL